MAIKTLGIEIKTGANPTVKNNKIRDGQSGGIYVRMNGLGTIKGK